MDDGLGCFQVAFGDERVAVASQHLPVSRRMNQISVVPEEKTMWDGVRR